MKFKILPTIRRWVRRRKQALPAVFAAASPTDPSTFVANTAAAYLDFSNLRFMSAVGAGGSDTLVNTISDVFGLISGGPAVSRSGTTTTWNLSYSDIDDLTDDFNQTFGPTAIKVIVPITDPLLPAQLPSLISVSVWDFGNPYELEIKWYDPDDIYTGLVFYRTRNLTDIATVEAQLLAIIPDGIFSFDSATRKLEFVIPDQDDLDNEAETIFESLGLFICTTLDATTDIVTEQPTIPTFQQSQSMGGAIGTSPGSVVFRERRSLRPTLHLNP